MPLDVHVRIAAWLCIVLNTLLVCAFVLPGIFGLFHYDIHIQAGAPGGPVFATYLFAVLLFCFLAVLTLAIVGGVLLLRDRPAGRKITIIFSVLCLVDFPVGTLLGLYTLWALSRTGPVASEVFNLLGRFWESTED